MLETDALVEMFTSPTIEEIREHLRCLRNIAEKGSLVERLGTAASGANVFRRDGSDWTIAYRGRTSRLRDCLGLRYLALLIQHTGHGIPALEITAGSSPSSGGLRTLRADPLLDARARSEYRERLSSLAEELEEATKANDTGRRESLQHEIDEIASGLRKAAGLAGRHRHFPSERERARLNVSRAIRGALGRIARVDPALGAHLSRAVHTGGVCCYDPDPAALPQWEVETRPTLRR